MNEPKIKDRYKLVAINYVGKCLGNAEKSMIEAGYSKRYARGNAYKIVARKDVQEYIEHLKSHPVQKGVYDLQDLRKFWTNIVKSNEYKTSDRLRASELLGKSLQAFNDDNW